MYILLALVFFLMLLTSVQVNMHILSVFHQVLTSIIVIIVFLNEFNNLRNSTYFRAKLGEKRKSRNVKMFFFLTFLTLFLNMYISEVAAFFCLVFIQSTQVFQQQLVSIILMFLMKYLFLLVTVAMVYLEHLFQTFGSPNNGLREQDFNLRYIQLMRFNL